MKAGPLLILAGGLLAASAHAQLRLPSLPSPALPLPRLQAPAVAPLPQVQLPPAQLRLGELVTRYPQQVERDPAGQAIRRAELVWLSPSDGAVRTALAQGFTVLRDERLAEIDVHEWLLRAPPGVGTPEAAERLRGLDPQAQVDFNHLYLPSGEAAAASAGPGGSVRAAARIGLVDGGVRRAAAGMRADAFVHWGCDGREVASEHGTAIASLMQGATLYAADVYCGEPAGGAAESVARALAWLAAERVAVINVSLVGPPNRLLERAVAALVARGHIIVAAVGNDGPAAPPLYPASYPGVVGVTGVLPDQRVLPEAAQGPQVMFAAPGAEVPVARTDGGAARARGTSYAAPFVAMRLAQWLQEPQPQAAHAAVERLAASAIDLGAPGRDPVYGFGLIAPPH